MADKPGTHVTPNSHDAEEAMRPYLLAVLETGTAAVESVGSRRYQEAAEKESEALAAALEKALELLGVSR